MQGKLCSEVTVQEAMEARPFSLKHTSSLGNDVTQDPELLFRRVPYNFWSVGERNKLTWTTHTQGIHELASSPQHGESLSCDRHEGSGRPSH